MVSGAALLTLGAPSAQAAAAADDFAALRDKVTEARRQLDPIPKLIKEEKWDSIRAILITPPLSDCWGKASGVNALLRSYAVAVGDQGGDELAALEAREEALDHLRFLDMAAYNNVFNPIKTEGESGASKGLIKSYYEDPINELKASTSALDALVQLGDLIDWRFLFFIPLLLVVELRSYHVAQQAAMAFVDQLCFRVAVRLTCCASAVQSTARCDLT